MKNLLTLLIPVIFAFHSSAQNFPIADNYGQRAGNASSLPCSSPLASDGGNAWVPVGPWGGDVIDLGANPLQPMTLFAAAGAPFVTNDGGDSWTVLEALSNLVSGPVNSIEAAANGILIATGTYTFGKVYRSTDGGSAWQSRSYPVNSTAQCIAMDPNDTNTMYVGLASNTAVTLNKVIVKSVNGGVNWTAIDLTPVLVIGYGVVSLCVDPSDSQTIFAIGREGFSNALVVASFDGGVTWEDRTGSLPAGIPYNAVAIGGGNVYIAGGQLFGSQNMGVYKSTDYGLTWTNISASFPNKVSNSILIDPANSDNLFVATEGDGIYSSADGGTTWDYTTTGAGENGAARTLLFRPGSSDTIYAGYLSIAVCLSADAGSTWEYATTGIATLPVNDVEIDPVDPAVVLAGFEAQNSGGCFLSLDTGTTWSLVTGLPGTRFSKVGFLADGAMCAWSNGPTTVAQEGLYKSTDGGVAWNNMGPNVGNLFETEIFALATSATDPGLVFIGGNNFGVNGWASVIHRSKNGGQTWENVYIGSFPDNFESVRYIFIDPLIPGDQVVYAAMKSEVQGAILKSEDGGDTWNVISGGIGAEKWFGSVVSFPDSSMKIIAGSGGSGTKGTAWISGDGGTSWTGTDLTLGNYSKVQDLMISPENTSVIYAATGDDGVYLSTDGGWNWVAANDGLPASNVTGFCNPFQSGPDWNVFASTYSNSIFRTKVYDPATGIGEKTANGELLVYPNPSDGMMIISAGSVSENDLKVEMYNAVGMLVGVYHPFAISGTETTLRLDLPAGIYVGRVISQGATRTFRVVMK